MNKVKETVYKIVMEEYGLEKVTNDTIILNESGLDGNKQRDLIMRIEDELNVEISDTDAEKLIMVKDLVIYLETKITKDNKND